jgi:uncharacterized membrane protein
MPRKSFSYSEVLGFGWRVMKSNFWFFVGVTIVVSLISFSGQIAGGIMTRHQKVISPFWFFAALGVSFIIQIIVRIGLVKIALGFCDSQKPRFSTLFKGLDCFLRYIVTGLLYGLIISGASIACVLPLVLLTEVLHNPFFAVPLFATLSILLLVLLIKFSLCFYFVIDKGLGPIKALKASNQATEGAKWPLIVFFILCSLINLLGMLCFLVGLLATVPTVMVATALVYRQLSTQTPELAKLGIRSPSINPSGVVQPFASMQPNPIIPFIQSIQSTPSVRPSRSVQPSQSAQPALAVGHGHGDEKQGNNPATFWFVALAIVNIIFAASISYRLWPRSKSKVAVSLKNVAVSLKNTAASSNTAALKGILYSEDNSSAMVGNKIVKEGDTIDGIKVIKINKDTVEFEKDGERYKISCGRPIVPP